MQQKAGFTLIELSMTLVIIGLLVGGILMGQSLIEGAEIRKTLKQREDFQSAANTFRVKYNCLPGDCRDAFVLGLASSVDGSGDYGEAGNGDGIIGDSGNPDEAVHFWYHLSEANLISWQHPGGILPVPQVACTNYSPCLAKDYRAYNGQKAGWWVHSTYSGVFITNNSLPYAPGNYLWMTGSVGQLAANDSAVFLPIEAYRLDVKIDDGRPLTGQVLAAGDVPNNAYGPGNATVGATNMDGTCVINLATPQEYSLDAELLDGTSKCSLLTKAAF